MDDGEMVQLFSLPEDKAEAQKIHNKYQAKPIYYSIAMRLDFGCSFGTTTSKTPSFKLALILSWEIVNGN